MRGTPGREGGGAARIDNEVGDGRAWGGGAVYKKGSQSCVIVSTKSFVEK